MGGIPPPPMRGGPPLPGQMTLQPTGPPLKPLYWNKIKLGPKGNRTETIWDFLKKR